MTEEYAYKILYSIEDLIEVIAHPESYGTGLRQANRNELVELLKKL